MISKMVLAIVVSWYSPLGFLVSQGMWGNYLYKETRRIVADAPLAGIQNEAPKKLNVGSPSYWEFQKKAASEQIHMMRQAGIDGVLFDMVPRPAFVKCRYSASDLSTHPLENFKLLGTWMDAAKEESHDFKVGIFIDVRQKSAENPEGQVPKPAEWVGILSKALEVYGGHANILRIDGRPCLVHFGTVSSPLRGAENSWSGGWEEVLRRLRDSGESFYFVSDVRPRAKEDLLNWIRLSDAIHIFAPGAPLKFGVQYQSELLNMARANEKEYWWSVYPGYYHPGLAYTEPSFERMHKLWMGAINDNARIVEIITWNDLTERTAIWPSRFNGHVLLELISFYSTWFKTGSMPKVAKNKVFLAFPVQVKNKRVTPIPWWPRWGKAMDREDRCYFWALTKEDLTLEVCGVGTVRLKKGLSYGKVGGAILPGKHQVRVSDGEGNTIISNVPRIVLEMRDTERLDYFYHEALPAT
jgi:hypothetical protein